MVYKWYILPIGWLYATHHLLREPKTTIEKRVNQWIVCYGFIHGLFAIELPKRFKPSPQVPSSTSSRCHGPFLVAAMRRVETRLVSGWSEVWQTMSVAQVWKGWAKKCSKLRRAAKGFTYMYMFIDLFIDLFSPHFVCCNMTWNHQLLVVAIWLHDFQGIIPHYAGGDGINPKGCVETGMEWCTFDGVINPKKNHRLDVENLVK